MGRGFGVKDITKMKTLDQRWKAVLRWCDKRGIEQLYAFFAGCDPRIEDHYNRIRRAKYIPGAVVTDIDEAWIRSMEETMAAIDSVKRERIAA